MTLIWAGRYGHHRRVDTACFGITNAMMMMIMASGIKFMEIAIFLYLFIVNNPAALARF